MIDDVFEDNTIEEAFENEDNFKGFKRFMEDGLRYTGISCFLLGAGLGAFSYFHDHSLRESIPSACLAFIGACQLRGAREVKEQSYEDYIELERKA